MDSQKSCVTMLQPHFVLTKWEPHTLWTFIISMLRYGAGCQNNHHLETGYILGKQHNVADEESWVSRTDTKWMLSARYLHQSLYLLSFKPNIDLFATQKTVISVIM